MHKTFPDDLTQADEMYVFVKSQVFRKCQSSPAWTHTILRQQIVDLERVKARGRVWERQALGCQLERRKSRW